MMRQPDHPPREARVDPPLLLAFLLPVFAVAPLAYPGYFELRSGFLPIFALADRLAHLGDLTWAPAVGAAYSLFGGDGPLLSWAAALPAALGADGAAAIKWALAASLVAGSVGAFCWTRARWPEGWPALVAAAVYILNPLTLSLVYAEGAAAAVLLLALLPWTLWATDRALTRGPAWLIGLAVLVAAAIWTQAALGLLWAAALVAYALAARPAGWTRGGRSRALLGLLAGVLLAALLWLPVILGRGVGAPRALMLTVWLTLALPWLALVAGWIAARLSAMLEPGEARLRPALAASLIALILLGAYAGPRPVELRAAVPAAPLAIYGDNEIALLDVKTEGAPGPGGRVVIEPVWQALRPLDRDYTVFFHVVGPDGARVGQQDGFPQGGQAPTSGWTPGRLVADRYEAALAADAPLGGPYRYWLGFYDAATGQRLSVGMDDKFVVTPEP